MTYNQGIVDAQTGITNRQRELEKRLEALEQGECRFNCRTQRAMFIIGYKEAIANIDFGGDVPVSPEKAYNEWKERCQP